MAHGDTHIKRNFDTGELFITREIWDIANGKVHFLPISGHVILPEKSIVLGSNGQVYYKPPHDTAPPTLPLG